LSTNPHAVTAGGASTYTYDANGNMTASAGLDAENLAAIRTHTRSGRPLGAEPFLARLEKRIGRKLGKAKAEPKAKPTTNRRRN
jgi:hypothetical protein